MLGSWAFLMTVFFCVSKIMWKVFWCPAEALHTVYSGQDLQDRFQGEGSHQVTREKMDEPKFGRGSGPPGVRVQSSGRAGIGRSVQAGSAPGAHKYVFILMSLQVRRKN